MLETTISFQNMVSSPIRTLIAKAEIYDETNTLVNQFLQDDYIKSINIQRVGTESKFFGFGICQRLNLKLLDVQREFKFTTANSIKISFSVKGGEGWVSFPRFKISEVNRDENTNQLSITAYDDIKQLDGINFKELELSYPLTLLQVINAVATKMAWQVELVNCTADDFSLSYEKGEANLDGEETLREILTAIAEATQTIFYLNENNKLVFKRLDKDGQAVLLIDKSQYFTLKNKNNRRLVALASATELGENYGTVPTISGTTQYIRNNPFWELRTDIGELVDKAFETMGGLTIGQFNCNWRGNPALEIGDKLKFTTKDDNNFTSFLINDTIDYNGAFTEKTEWNYDADDEEDFTNSTNITDAMRKTYARVDKVNKQIDIVVAGKDEIEDKIAKLQLTTDGINATVSSNKAETDDRFNSVNDNLNALAKSVSATMTQDQINILIQQQLANSVDSVKTATGFTFNADGLTIEKSGNEMKTQIDEDGMTIFKDNQEVLTVNNTGVDAYNLKATTYLIIGNETRFEKFNHKTRGTGVGCFWLKDAPTALTGGEADGNQFSQNNWR